MSLLYINLVPSNEQKEFEEKVKYVANLLLTNPDWLMQVMKAESNIRADIRNTSYPFKDGYATGLIQFIPDTARSLGTTTTELEKMSRVQQMDYVYKYFKPYTGRLNSYFDVYLVVFFPVAIGKPDSWVFEIKNLSRTKIAKSNPAIDINKDGQITIAEFKQYLINTVQEQYRKDIFEAADFKKKGK